MRNAWAIVALGVCAAVCSAAAPQAQSKQHAAPAAAKATSQAKLSDAQLEAVIKAKFAKSKSANKFTVRVQGGVAHIDGKTDVVQHKASATRMAKAAGAVAVDNKVQLSDAAKQKAAGNLDEGRRRAQVKRGDARDGR